MSNRHAALVDMIAPVVESMQLQFWGLEFSARGKHSLLRIYIDHENGVNVDDCAKVSRQVSSVLDVEDPISQEYVLEVSSPGMDRPLFNVEQFEQYKGNIIDVRLRMAFEGRRKFKGQLTGVEDSDVVMIVDDHEYLLPIDSIDRACVVPQFTD